MNKLEILAKEITGHLEDAWLVIPNGDRSDSYHLISDQKKINITLDGYDFERSKKVTVSGVYPCYTCQRGGGRGSEYVMSGEKLPRIGCSISRGAKAIARDIERRFLPEFCEKHELALTRIEEYTTINNARWRVAEDFIKVVNGRAVATWSGLLDLPEVQFDLPYSYSHGCARFRDDDVKLELHGIPVGLAMQIGVLVMQYIKDGRAADD